MATIRDLEDNTILLGDEAEAFFKTDLGRYVVESAMEEINEAMVKLKTVDPEDIKIIRELQTKIRVAEAAPRWLQDAIRSGNERLEMRMQEEESQT